MAANLTTTLVLQLDALIRSVSVNKNTPHAFLLGAGASVTSQVPSATDCLWEWKRRIVLTRNPSLDKELYDLSIQSVRQKIQLNLDTEGRYPTPGNPDEYGVFVEECYPISQDRQKYFQRLAEKSSPSNGYRYLCLLALANIVKSVWTTNFDGLVRRVASQAQGLTIIEAGLDTTERAVRPISQQELLIVQMHGDYRYDALKNTSLELKSQDEVFRKELIRYLRDVNLIVAGYSGRDQSIMATLEEAYSQPGQGRLYWCGYDQEHPTGIVHSLLLRARTNNRQAFYVPAEGFDDLMVRLSLECLEGDLQKRAIDLRNKSVSKADIKPPPFTVEPGGRTIALAKGNAFHIECPSQIYQLDIPTLNREGAWKTLREMTKGNNISAGLLRQKVLAIGSSEEIKTVFGNKLNGPFALAPIDEKELTITDGVITHIFTTAIAESIGQLRELTIARRNRDIYLWDSESLQTIMYEGSDYRVYESVYLFLRRYKNKNYLILEPTVRITTLKDELLLIETDKLVRNFVLSKRYNNQVDAVLERWRTLICPEESLQFGYPDDSSIFHFVLSREPLYARITGSRSAATFALSQHFQNMDHQRGVEYAEPPLVFSNRQGDGRIKDVHPLRGISMNRPFDYRLSEDVLGREITVGVICPSQDKERVSAFLNGLKSKVAPKRLPDEYLMEYPGFDLAYGLPLDIPQPHNSTWGTVGEPDPNADTKRGASELIRNIQTTLDSLFSSTSAKVVIIYIPKRWSNWEGYSFEGENFDLHDWIKAYCIQKGKATQLIREKTLEYYDPCRVRWWLSLAIYVKAGRTPWILDTTDNETAFMGIGYTFLPNAPKDSHIVVGCSHIYNAAGLGLGYRLSKIDEPEVDRRNNPYLSQDDARRLGENTKQLFYASGVGLPKRVVIHKRTPFRETEIKGFIEGLSGIAVVDMLELTEENSLKYLNGKNTSDQIFNPDNFAIRRGTSIPIDDQKALLWVHGVTDALRPGWRFFLGGRGIPSPLMITRHYGNSSLALISKEIMGLSKMNWNNFDFYSHIPATIDTANDIARIGVLLQRFGALQYDYRLFI